MKITTAQLDAFSAVLDLGTATAAASVLNTSQPSITRAIKQLEDATGLLLFSDLQSADWVIITTVYIGGQTVIDAVTKLKGYGDR